MPDPVTRFESDEEFEGVGKHPDNPRWDVEPEEVDDDSE